MTEGEYEFEYSPLRDEFSVYIIERDTEGMKHRRLVAVGDDARKMKLMLDRNRRVGE